MAALTQHLARPTRHTISRIIAASPLQMSQPVMSHKTATAGNHGYRVVKRSPTLRGH